ncbi:MAG: hypothetical protein EAZ99_18510 [Alphaproteobacteria bacterium]|nr:MAG: hypothetical protein EAZ99_18510 [Alphaproteobacteria bacterium]
MNTQHASAPAAPLLPSQRLAAFFGRCEALKAKRLSTESADRRMLAATPEVPAETTMPRHVAEALLHLTRCAALLAVLAASMNALAPAAAEAAPPSRAAAAPAVVAQTPAAQMVVSQSTTASLPQSDVIDGTRAITLAAGESVTLIDDVGAVRTIDGPYRGRPVDRRPSRPGTGQAGTVAMLAQVLRLNRDPSVSKLATPWLVNVQRPGPACAQTDRVEFWRATVGEDVRLSIDLGGRRAAAAWPRGSETLRLPAAMFTSGESYKAQLGSEAPVMLVVHLLPPATTSPVDQAVWMAAKGCKSQALTLLDQIR